jgi:tRNA A37 threonylcarbamoyladenosine dehydratase
MLNQFSRTELLLGKESMDTLSNARVAVFGIGGVGGFTVEALARSGVGSFDLFDDDKVCITNINRQR